MVTVCYRVQTPVPEYFFLNYFLVEKTMRIFAIAALTLSSLFLAACGNNEQAAQVSEKAEAVVTETAAGVEEATADAAEAVSEVAAEASETAEAAVESAEEAIEAAAEETAVTTAE